VYAMRMPFGKHEGKLLRDIPTGYLCWLTTLADLKPYLRDAVEAELERRPDAVRRDDDDRPHRPEPKTPALPWRPVVDRWYHDLVLRNHPDRGGDTRVMQVINDAKDRLVKLFEATA
jgi:Putative quorum-sensing-regulated virulence factor